MAEFYSLLLRDNESSSLIDSFFVPAGTVENSLAIHRREARSVLLRPVGTLEFRPAGTQASLQDALLFASFLSSKLLGYFQTVPGGTKAKSNPKLTSHLRNISYSTIAPAFRLKSLEIFLEKLLAA